MKTEITNNVKDTVFLWGTNLGAIGIGIADFNAILTTISLSLAIIITLYNQAKTMKNDKKS